MSDFTELWNNNQRLHELFGNKQSFCSWAGRNYDKIFNKPIEKIIKIARKRTLCYEKKRLKATKTI